MRNLKKTLLALFLFAFVISCNEEKKNKATDDKKTSLRFDFSFLNSFFQDTSKGYSALANIIIPTPQAQAMVGNYKGNFENHPTSGARITALKDSIWLDKSDVYDLEKLLNDSTKYSGYRVYHISNPADIDATSPKPYQQKTNIVFLPVKVTDGVSYLDKNFAKPGNIHTNYIKSYSEASPLLSNFTNLYCSGLSNPNNKKFQSSGVLFDREVILVLAKLLRTDEQLPDGLKRNLNGINVLSASYFGTESTQDCPGGMVDAPSKQSTFVIVPSRLAGGRTENDWDVLDMLNAYFVQRWYKILGGYNHGELCPQLCN